MGGGKNSFVANTSMPPMLNPKDIVSSFFVDKNVCTRTDGKNLIKEWIKDKISKHLSYQYLSSVNDIYSLDTKYTDYILGGYNTG